MLRGADSSVQSAPGVPVRAAVAQQRREQAALELATLADALLLLWAGPGERGCGLDRWLQLARAARASALLRRGGASPSAGGAPAPLPHQLVRAAPSWRLSKLSSCLASSARNGEIEVTGTATLVDVCPVLEWCNTG